MWPLAHRDGPYLPPTSHKVNSQAANVYCGIQGQYSIKTFLLCPDWWTSSNLSAVVRVTWCNGRVRDVFSWLLVICASERMLIKATKAPVGGGLV